MTLLRIAITAFPRIFASGRTPAFAAPERRAFAGPRLSAARLAVPAATAARVGEPAIASPRLTASDPARP